MSHYFTETSGHATQTAVTKDHVLCPEPEVLLRIPAFQIPSLTDSKSFCYLWQEANPHPVLERMTPRHSAMQVAATVLRFYSAHSMQKTRRNASYTLFYLTSHQHHVGAIY